MTTFAAKLAGQYRDQVAIRDPHSALGWAEVDEVLNRAVNALLALDLGPEQRVAVFAENALETGLANLAGLLAGASVVPVNFHLTAEEVTYILDDCAARVLFVDAATLERGLEASAASAVHTIVSWAGSDRVSVHDWARWLAASDPAEPPSDMAPRPNLLYTSGTTGRPKGTPLPPTMFAGGASIAEHIENMALQANARGPLGTQLVVGPMYHTGPLSSTRLLAAGVPSVILGRFDAENTLRTIEQYRIESTLMVPTHFVRLLALPDPVKASYDLSSLVRVSHTGAKCPVDVKKAMIDWFGPVLFEAYGASEVGTTNAITSEEWLTHPGSVGKTLEPFEAMILDDQGHPLPPNTEGRLFFRDKTGRGVVYHNAPEKQAEAHIAPGVFTLGEIAYLDEEGYVYITDRFSDMIVSGGVNVYPAEAEQVLIQHPRVLDVACIGVPNEEMGEELKALVILKPEMQEKPVSGDLVDWCRERLSHYKCPRSLDFVDDLGRNTMGKINKRKLRAPFWV